MDENINKIKKEAIEEYQNSQTFSAIEFAKQMNQIMLESMSDKNKVKFYKKYTNEEVGKYLADPARYEKQLREISRYLSVSSPQYWRLINYFPSIAVIRPLLVPLDIEKFKKNIKKSTNAYSQYIKQLEIMQLQHEFSKILQTLFREDVFYGYEIETPDSYYIKPLNPQYCKIHSVYDGSYIYQFDFSYFDVDKTQLELYASIDSEFKTKYNEFKTKGSEFRWQEINPDKEVCFKIQETFDFCCPPFISVFNDLYDISDYKDLNKAKVEMDNTKFIGFNMEVKGKDSSKLDDFVLDTNTMKTYFAFIQSCLQGKVGTFMSPMPFQEISFPNQKSDVDNISNSIKSFWSSTGVADVLVGENKNAGTLKYSIKTDEALLFSVYKQFSRWLSRKFKKLSGGLFTVKIPDLTIFNIDEQYEKYLKASEYGYQGSKTMVEVTLNFSQNDIEGLGFLENEILNKHDNMIPVTSTHTMNGNEEGGAPAEKNDGNVSDSSQQTRDDNSNENR